MEGLPVKKMGGARGHVESCGDCRFRVEKFERTPLALKAVPDLDPPRRIVFSAPEPRSWFSRLDWRAAAGAGAAAALLAGVVIRLAPVPAPVNVSMPAVTPVVVQSEKIDYERIINEVRQS